MDVGSTAIWICLAIASAAAIWDFISRKIPNFLTLGGVVLGLVLHAAVGYVDNGIAGSIRGLGASLAGIAVCSIIPVVSYARNEMGGGDVKLLAAIGALCGPVFGFFAEGFAFAILFAVVLPWRIIWSGAFHDRLGNFFTWLGNVFRRREDRLPYQKVRKMPPVVLGPAILAGLAVAIVHNKVWP
ncbi:prepilin peptidase [Pendulispora albinea]|uniref:A24 family peptidase n=1 Tax=Pendulispora albinea TaxID=2741071 RepID=A0ABZ2LW59_9BACT